jgi:hypothetical protein
VWTASCEPSLLWPSRIDSHAGVRVAGCAFLADAVDAFRYYVALLSKWLMMATLVVSTAHSLESTRPSIG